MVSLCYVSLHQRWGAKPMILYILSQKKGEGGGAKSFIICNFAKKSRRGVSLCAHSLICISYRTYEIDYCSLLLSFHTKSGRGVAPSIPTPM